MRLIFGETHSGGWITVVIGAPSLNREKMKWIKGVDGSLTPMNDYTLDSGGWGPDSISSSFVWSGEGSWNLRFRVNRCVDLRPARLKCGQSHGDDVKELRPGWP